LDFGKKVDATAKDFIAAVIAEEDRLKKARGEFAELVLAERRRILQEMEEKRLAEEKARREAEAKEAARLEAARVAAEAAEKARIAAEEAAFNATTPEEDAAAAKAAEEAAKQAAELAAREAARLAAEKAEAQRKASEVITPTFVPEAPKGVKFEWDFDVTDAFALLIHNNTLVDLVPKRAAILAHIKGMATGEEAPFIPGLAIKKTAKVTSR
jgi:hypothetical protein